MLSVELLIQTILHVHHLKCHQFLMTKILKINLFVDLT